MNAQKKGVSMPSDFTNLDTCLAIGMWVNQSDQLELYTIALNLTRYTQTSDGSWKSQVVDWFSEITKGRELQPAIYTQD